MSSKMTACTVQPQSFGWLVACPLAGMAAAPRGESQCKPSLAEEKASPRGLSTQMRGEEDSRTNFSVDNMAS